jgi:adenylate cyclase
LQVVRDGAGREGQVGDEAAYRDDRDRYRKMATELGFEGHIAMANAMP